MKYNVRVILHKKKSKRGEQMPSFQSLSSELRLRQKYDLKYNAIKKLSCKIGSTIEFNTSDGIKIGAIGKIYKDDHQIVMYLVSIADGSCIELYKVKRSEIIRVLEGKT